MVSALEYAHDHGLIVHRDLKPSNLMVDSRSRLKITDFGIARSLSDSVSRVSVRQPGATSGSPPYMSPQQVLGERASGSDDIYSLGATLYDLLTGKPPCFSGNIYRQIEDVVPPSMADRRQVLEVANAAAIPEIWEQTVAACLAKNPADRPVSVREFWERLTVVPSPPVPTKVIRPPASKQEPGQFPRRLLVGVALFIALLMVAGAWFGYQTWQERRQTESWTEIRATADRMYQEGDWTGAETRYAKLVTTPQSVEAKEQLAKITAIKSAFADADKAIISEDLAEARLIRTKLQEIGVSAPLLDGLEVSILKLERKNQLTASLDSARAAVAAKGWDSAIRYADAALRIDPASDQAKALLMEAKAGKAGATKIAQAEEATQAKIGEAQRALDWDKPDEAKEILLGILKSDPGNPEAARLLEKANAAPKPVPPAPASVSTSGLTASEIRVAAAENGPILTFPSGQRMQIPGSGKGILGPSTDPSRQLPLVSPDGKVVAVTSQPETKSAYAYLMVRGSDGIYSSPQELNPALLGFSLPGLTVSEYFVRVQRVENDLVFLQTADLTGLEPKMADFALRLMNGRPFFPDGDGAFSISAVFTGGPYVGFNSYAKEQVLRRVQQTLKDRNFYASSLDGAMGRGTQSAIIKFQQTENIAPTGLLDSSTLSALDLPGLTESQPPPPSKKPAVKKSAPKPAAQKSLPNWNEL